MQSVYTAKHGLIAQQQRMNAISSNIANVNTTGYKSQSAGFKDALYTRMIDPANIESDANLLQGSGLILAGTHRDFSVGAPSLTSQKLDFYLEGDGFFAVSNGEETMYTRNGAFSVSVQNNQRYLVTADGYYVLNTRGERIVLPPEDSNLTVTEDGVLNLGEGRSAKLNIVTFVNKDGLFHNGGSCYLATDASGEPQESAARVIQGRLETSNVDIALEMTRLIRTQRAYSIAARVLSTWNEMETETNNIL
ncbi:MAG: flagellar hook-basal body protein [Christensenellales bacterium]|jgi:flagellar basal-body rod protein FlgG